MTITIFSLDSLLKNFDEPFVEKLLHSFKGFPIPDGAHDVEVFLHQNAINFERSATATTYLVFDEETKIPIYIRQNEDMNIVIKKSPR